MTSYHLARTEYICKTAMSTAKYPILNWYFCLIFHFKCLRIIDQNNVILFLKYFEFFD